MRDARTWMIVVLLALVVWLGAAVIRLERYHYAAMLATCGFAADQLEHGKQQSCLGRKGSLRTSPAWDLVYGLRVL